MSNDDRRGHAVVLGAGIGGLLAARVLSGSYATVAVLDRDDLPEGWSARRGVPHGAHLHGLLARGREIIEELFPGATAELAAQGAVPVDMQRDFVWYPGGRRLPRAASGLAGLCVSRPALEGHLRRRVAALPNVTIHSRQQVVGLVAGAGRITGVRLADDTTVAADLVVDATGRGSRAPSWLADLGFARPTEEGLDTATVYVSRDYRRRPGDADFSGAFMPPSARAPRGGFVIAAEGDRWMVVLLGVGPGQAPPTDPDGYTTFSHRLSGPEIADLLATAPPVGEPRRLRLPPSVRRRYERLRHAPDGFVAVGDAFCAFNPSYAQGMTVAAIQAAVLRDCLRSGDRRLPRRFFRAAARAVDPAWQLGLGADLAFGHVPGRRPVPVKLIGRYVERFTAAAAGDADLARRYLAVGNLMASPGSLFAPAALVGVLRARPAGPAAPAEPAAPAYPLALSDAEVDRYRFMADLARASEADQWLRAGLRPGARVADIGCGPGALFPALAEAVGPGGRIEAVDADPQAVAAATELARAAGLDTVAVRLGRADDTGLEPGSFDVVMMRHVLGHNAEAEHAIVTHLATLLRPGGCLYLVDVDTSAVRIQPHHPELAELDGAYRELHARRGNDGRSGLRLGELIQGSGLDLVDFSGRHTISPIPVGVRPPSWAARTAIVGAGVASGADVARWDRALSELDGTGERPTYIVPVFTAIGRLPVR